MVKLWTLFVKNAATILNLEGYKVTASDLLFWKQIFAENVPIKHLVTFHSNNKKRSHFPLESGSAVVISLEMEG